MTAEATCPNCGANKIPYSNNSWDCGAFRVVAGGESRLVQTAHCVSRAENNRLTARVAELEGERERLREAFWASHTSFEMMFTPQGFVAVDRKTRRHIGGPCEFAVDAALAALAPPEPHDSKEGK
jgi:hypothetical protein